ncbi:MAG: MFS transporter [Gammaproteobacteria bacterium]
MNATRVSRSTEILWSSGSIATGAVFNAMALFALFYMTSILGIAPAVAGALIFITKLYDAVTDPLMGAISDRTRHRLGPRRPYLLVGSVALAISVAAFFSLPVLEGTPMLLLVTLALLLYSTSYTIFAVPYLAMPPSIAPTYDARTRLMSFRVAFLIFGVLIGSAGGPRIVQAGGEGRGGYVMLGIVMGALVLVGGALAFFGTRRVIESVPDDAQSGSLTNWRAGLTQIHSIFSHAPFRLLTIVKLLQLAVLALALACTPYFFRLVLERSIGDITAYLTTFSLTGLASIFFWRWAISRFGKHRIYVISITLYALAMASWMLWQPGESEVFFYGRAVWIGIVSNGTLLCALALLPDTMEYDRLMSGDNRSGIMSGVFTTVEKIAGALGPLIIGVMLQATGLITGPGTPEQPPEALFAVRLGISIVPAIICLAAVPFLLRYGLTEERLNALRDGRAGS